MLLRRILYKFLDYEWMKLATDCVNNFKATILVSEGYATQIRPNRLWILRNLYDVPRPFSGKTEHKNQSAVIKALRIGIPQTEHLTSEPVNI